MEGVQPSRASLSCICSSVDCVEGTEAEMPGASGGNVEGSCQALCQTLISQNGLQRETADISQSVLYTSLMGLLLVTDKEVGGGACMRD